VRRSRRAARPRSEPGEPALPATLFSTVVTDAGGPDVSGIDFVYLLPGDATALAEILEKAC